jgi:hypothetical protein
MNKAEKSCAPNSSFFFLGYGLYPPLRRITRISTWLICFRGLAGQGRDSNLRECPFFLFRFFRKNEKAKQKQTKKEERKGKVYTGEMF